MERLERCRLLSLCQDGEDREANAYCCVDVLERSDSPECCGDEHKGESDLEEKHASHQKGIEDSHKTVDALELKARDLSTNQGIWIWGWGCGL
jgi:hypothetical protein